VRRDGQGKALHIGLGAWALGDAMGGAGRGAMRCRWDWHNENLLFIFVRCKTNSILPALHLHGGSLDLDLGMAREFAIFNAVERDRSEIHIRSRFRFEFDLAV
jgi:hypothetical protein